MKHKVLDFVSTTTCNFVSFAPINSSYIFHLQFLSSKVILVAYNSLNILF